MIPISSGQPAAAPAPSLASGSAGPSRRWSAAAAAPLVLLAAILGVACSRASGPPAGSDPEAAGARADGTTAGADRVDEPRSAAVLQALTAPRHSVVVLAHDPASASGRARQVLVHDEAPRALGSFEVAAVPLKNRPGHYQIVAGHDGGDALVVATAASASGPAQLAIRDLGERSAWRTVDLADDVPAALHVAGGWAYVGQLGRVSALDLGEPAPTVRELVRRPDMQFKAYDVFARAGAWLIAIDDVVTPIFADSFDLSSGRPAHRAGFELPGAVNGHYALAALRADGSFGGDLYAIIPFHVIDGPGHDLVRLEMLDGSYRDPRGGVLVNTGGSRAVPMVGEADYRGSGRPSSLLAGSERTAWTGLAHVATGGAGTVLVAANERGLFAFDGRFKSGSRPVVHDLGGAVVDVIADGARCWILRRTDDPDRLDLVALQVLGPSEVRIGRGVALDGRFERFVQ